MKKLLKTSGIMLVILLAVIFHTNQACAQNQPPQPPNMLPDSTQIVKMVDELSKELSLSKSQKTKITELHFAHFEEAKAMMEKSKTEHEKNKEAMDIFRKKFEAQVSELLTDEQKTEFEDLMKNRRPPQKEKQKPRH